VGQVDGIQIQKQVQLGESITLENDGIHSQNGQDKQLVEAWLQPWIVCPREGMLY
jgi:hypothetical protein